MKESVRSFIVKMEVEESKTIRKSTKRSSSSNGKTRKKGSERPRKRPSNEKKKSLENTIPIFTEEFLNLFRQQKSEIRSLKLNNSQLTEKVKLKDAQQEQIRLDNQKMRADIEEISQKNSLLQNQLDLIEKEFHKHFPDEILNSQFLQSLQQHSNEQIYQNKIEKIHQILHL